MCEKLAELSGLLVTTWTKTSHCKSTFLHYYSLFITIWRRFILSKICSSVLGFRFEPGPNCYFTFTNLYILYRTFWKLIDIYEYTDDTKCCFVCSDSAISAVPPDASSDVFLNVASSIFDDGVFNWGRVVALFYYAYKVAIKVSLFKSSSWRLKSIKFVLALFDLDGIGSRMMCLSCYHSC